MRVPRPYYMGAVRTCVVVGFLAVLAAACGGRGPQAAPAPGRDRGVGSRERILKTALHAIHARGEHPLACQDCHELLAGEYQPAKSFRCVECHTAQPLSLHASASAESGARECWSCHDFSAADKAPIPCLTCHGRALGGLAAIAPHDPKRLDEDCGACHRAHAKPSLQSTRCESCHDREKVSGHDKPDIPITGCASCHGYHEKAAVASERCTGCHRQSRARVPRSSTFKGHDKCTGCHRPHRFFKSEVVACTQCHDHVHVLAQEKVAEHRDCLSCHDQHAVRQSAPQACERCHRRDVAPEHPRDRQTGTRCLGCHQPHAGAGAPLAKPCSQCHRFAASDTGLHQGPAHRGPACRDCHKPHAFDLADSGVPLCLGCHGAHRFKNAPQVRPRPEHADCFRCHGQAVAHQPDRPPVACGSCHQDKASLVRAGHAQCVGCHEPHSGALRTQCSSCHAEQARTAPEPHQRCLGCHEPHGGRVKKQCAECHQDRATGIHKNVPGGCMSCHRPHGPKGPAVPPQCTTCHDPARLPGLHQVPQHHQCTSCHRSHGEQPYRRPAACLTCHRAQKDHEPTAAMCIGCHVFMEGR